MAETKQCAGMVRYDAWTVSQCKRQGKLECNGQWYCKQHHPPSVQTRRSAESEKWQAEARAQRETRSAAAAKQAELERRSRAYDAVMGWCEYPGPFEPDAIKNILEDTK